MSIQTECFSVYALNKMIGMKRLIVPEIDQFDKSKIIECLLLGIPLLPMYALEDRLGAKTIIKNGFLLKVIIDFMQNKFCLDSPYYEKGFYSEMLPQFCCKLEDSKIQIVTFCAPFTLSKEEILSYLEAMENK